jgi:hypothetical protein
VKVIETLEDGSMRSPVLEKAGVTLYKGRLNPRHIALKTGNSCAKMSGCVVA